MKQSPLAFSLRDLAVTLAILGAATGLSFLLRPLEGSSSCASLLFILAVFLVSRYTTGYLFGLLASLSGVFLVNYIFTYPYFALNFTIAGYPLTFLSMLAVSVMTSALTTQIKQQEKLRAEAEKERMRGNLLRAVSHDLRTPLTSIVGATSALLENSGKFSREQQEDLLREAHDDAEWLIRMVENLLSITRINSGEARIRKTPEAAEEIVGEAVRKFQNRFPDAGLTVSVPEELLIVPMDAILIEQVLTNLLENAVLHGGRKDGILVSVEAGKGESVFTVRDHGAGIPESVFPHLFDGFAGGRDNEGDSKRNMGIGLSVCRSIVRAHGGTMRAGNAAGGGAEFRFTLPLKEDGYGL